MLVLWTSVGAGMLAAGLGPLDDRAISHLGTDPRSMELFRTGLLVATVLLVAFASAANRRLARPTGFLGVFLIGMAGQAVVATVPIAGAGAAHTAHTTAGIVLGLSLPVLIWRFAAGQPAGGWRRQSYALMWLSVAASVAGVALSRAGLATMGEVVPALAFHLWVLVVTLRWQAWSGAPAGVRPGPGARRRV